MKFSEYSIQPEIKKSLEEMGFKRPTDIQYKCIPSILKHEDVLAIAQTGTGKTAAFAIPVLSMLSKTKQTLRQGSVRCLVLVPTRELALQLHEVFCNIGKYTELKIEVLHGGTDQDPQIDALFDGADVLIATPGRLFDLISQQIFHLKHIEFFILDEADRMLDAKFSKDIADLQKHLPSKRQTLFFSATIDNKIKKLAYRFVHQKAIRIQISPKDPVSKNVEHSVAFIEMDDKRFFLERLIMDNEGKKILVFVRTKVRAERVAAAMQRVNIPCVTLHGDKDQSERNKALEQFKKGEQTILIATDVSARGIDIPGVEMVVNYDLPDIAENYVHRIGRTGRGRAKGLAISFCSSDEKEMLEAIERILPKPIDRVPLTKKDYELTKLTSAAETADLKDILKEIEQIEQKSKAKFKGKKK